MVKMDTLCPFFISIHSNVKNKRAILGFYTKSQSKVNFWQRCHSEHLRIILLFAGFFEMLRCPFTLLMASARHDNS